MRQYPLPCFCVCARALTCPQLAPSPAAPSTPAHRASYWSAPSPLLPATAVCVDRGGVPTHIAYGGAAPLWHSLTARGPLDVPGLLGVAKQLARGLGEFHTPARAPHGDLGPHNMALVGGTSLRFTHVARVATGMNGPPGFFTPPDPTPTPKADVWSMGVTLAAVVLAFVAAPHTTLVCDPVRTYGVDGRTECVRDAVGRVRTLCGPLARWLHSCCALDPVVRPLPGQAWAIAGALTVPPLWRAVVPMCNPRPPEPCIHACTLAVALGAVGADPLVPLFEACAREWAPVPLSEVPAALATVGVPWQDATRVHSLLAHVPAVRGRGGVCVRVPAAVWMLPVPVTVRVCVCACRWHCL